MPEEYPAELFAAVHDGNPGDVACYLRACGDARRVLELGCGSGRVACALAAAGHEVLGIDRSPGALSLARKAGVPGLCADMRRFALRRRFHRVIIPYNGLFCLLDDDAVVDCLRCARRHLAPGGIVVFDGYIAHVEDPFAAGPVDAGPDPVATVRVDGRRWQVFESSRLWPAAQRVDATYTHVPDDGDTAVVATIAQRWFAVEELPELLARAGLMLLGLEGGFHGEPLTDGSEHFVARAGRRRAG